MTDLEKYARWVCEAKTTHDIWRRVEALSLVLEGLTPLANRVRNDEEIADWEWRNAGRKTGQRED